jgi:hypothetical protein
VIKNCHCERTCGEHGRTSEAIFIIIFLLVFAGFQHTIVKTAIAGNKRLRGENIDY